MIPDPSPEWLEPTPPPDDEVMYVDVDGYEGPLDLLLDLARRQKVDLAQISVLALAERLLAVALDGALAPDGLVVTYRGHERTDTAIDPDTGAARAAVTLRFFTEPA